MKDLNGYKVLYGIRGLNIIRCYHCGYTWSYNSSEECCPRCGTRI